MASTEHVCTIREMPTANMTLVVKTSKLVSIRFIVAARLLIVAAWLLQSDIEFIRDDSEPPR